MSYDIYLTDPVTREPIELEEAHYMRGGTYPLSGTTEAWLNITYNYNNPPQKCKLRGWKEANT